MTTPTPPERLTVTVEEAAVLLGISRGTAYEAVRTGELPAVRLGRRVLIPRARLRELLGEPDTREGGEPIEVNGRGVSSSTRDRGEVTALEP